MQVLLVLLLLLALSSSLYQVGRSRALRAAGGRTGVLHSLPSYYGYYVALWCGIPAVILIVAWLAAEPTVLKAMVVNVLPADLQGLPPARLSLLINEVRQLAASGDYRFASGPETQAAAEQYRALQAISFKAMVAGMLSRASPAGLSRCGPSTLR